MEVIIIADDLTGAAESAAAFAVAGFSAVVRLPFSRGTASHSCSSPQVLVFDTETRHASPDAAERRLASILNELPRRSPRIIYKKIDSTLRGPISAELAVLIGRLAAERLLVAPAFPAQGRTTVAGVQHVNGMPVDGSAATDSGSSSFHAHLPTMLNGPEGRAGALGLDVVDQGAQFLAEGLEAAFAQSRIVVVDAVIDLHLETIAAAIFRLRRMPLIVGSAGLARPLARHMPHVRRASQLPAAAPRIQTAHRETGVLVGCGSRHPASLGQAEHLRRYLNQSTFPVGAPCRQGDRATAAQLAARALRGCDVLLLSPAEPIGPHAGDAGEPSAWLGAAIAATCRLTTPAGLVLTGGETAFRALRAMDVHQLEVHSEIAHGIPMGTLIDPQIGPLPLITKAGGFGQPDALNEAVRRIRALTRPQASKGDMSGGSKMHPSDLQGSDQ